MNKKRCLVLTAHPLSWPSEKTPVLLLGEWCRQFSKENKTKKYDIKIIEYHWNQRNKTASDYLYLNSVYENYLEILSKWLNQLHDISYDSRFWRMILGPWLGYFIQIIFDRWESINCAINADEEISHANVLSEFDAIIIPRDMQDFLEKIPTDLWNLSLYSQIIRSSKISFPIKEISISSSSEAASDFCGNRLTSRQHIGNFLYRLRIKLACKNSIFFIQSYLPLFKQALLELKLFQFPQDWRTSRAPRVDLNFNLRKPLKSLGDSNEFESLLNKMIPANIPTVYLEGYKGANKLIAQLGWPKTPKTIFTANSHSSDDVFKIWAAQKLQTGSQLVIAQHGGNIGSAKWSFIEDHEISIADFYVSWGWSKVGRSNVVPLGSTRLFGRKTISCTKKAGLLLISTVFPRYSYFMYSVPIASQCVNYFSSQFQFVENLSPSAKKKLIVRLFADDYGWDVARRWRDKFPDINVDEGKKILNDLKANSKLVVVTYNATSHLETLFENIPTIVTWDPHYWELRDEACNDLLKLQKVGIFQPDPMLASQFVNKIWSDIDAWWLCPKTQAARIEFCEKYAHAPADLLIKLKQFLRNNEGN